MDTRPAHGHTPDLPSLSPAAGAALVSHWREVWRVASAKNPHDRVDASGRWIVAPEFAKFSHPLRFASLQTNPKIPEEVFAELIAAGLFEHRPNPWQRDEKRFELTEAGVEFCYEAGISPYWK